MLAFPLFNYLRVRCVACGVIAQRHYNSYLRHHFQQMVVLLSVKFNTCSDVAINHKDNIMQFTLHNIPCVQQRVFVRVVVVRVVHTRKVLRVDMYDEYELLPCCLFHVTVVK